ncbi:sulfotransferase [Mesorhizobium sp. PAMC28654]|uniref:sulfotransferase n=1 Tax=Mesorhizobium sp. PAMC28654 TaxID=2880934 RepID=UPI001D0AC114|nr:sulfotransferase [Mesorhizobium sp. PAMC28654]UDL87689.1 sulfotransferase [Mesorhizobium sp. PAMC28654]
MIESLQGTRHTGAQINAVLTAGRLGPVISRNMLPGEDGSNINGPSLIKVPDWAPGRLGAYYLYFAHHTGAYIRLAYSNSLQGPWRVHAAGVLALDQCPFIKEHIASPDVHIDHQRRRFVMYFHGPTKSGKGQMTFAATSGDGLHFNPLPEMLGPSYARIFRHNGWWYGLFGTDAVTLCRSRDGISDFKQGPVVLSTVRRRVVPRHVAVQKFDELLRVYYTRKGDAPERVLHGAIDLTGDWRQWKVRGATELLRPMTANEGADLPVRRSRPGPAKGRENALRDPAVFEEGGRTWLLYAVAAESGIALAEISFAEPPRITATGRAIASLQELGGRLVGGVGRMLSPRSSEPQIPEQTGSGIFIAGCARSGTTLSLSLMACFDDIYVHPVEAPYSLLDRLDRPETNLVVKRTADCHENLSQLPASVGLIYCVRHPFDALTSSHPETKHLRRFHVTTGRWEAEYDGLMRLREAHPERNILYLRYEDLIAKPDMVQGNIARQFGFLPAIPFSQDPNNPIRATSLRKWESNEEFRTYLHGLPPAFLNRVESFCREFGYDMPDWQ